MQCEGPARAGPSLYSVQTMKRRSTRSGTSNRSQPPTSTSVRTRLPNREPVITARRGATMYSQPSECCESRGW